MANDYYKFVKEKFPKQYERMQKYGRRNVSFSTIAPTGTVSLMTQTTSGLEPLFQPFYTRRVKVNPSDESMRVDFVDKMGDQWMEQAVLHPKFKMWCLWKIKDSEIVSVTQTDEELLNYYTQDIEYLQRMFEQSPWYKSTANDIDWEKRVKIQGIIQKYISHSISSTINLPNDVAEAEVKDIYLSSWKEGLKGVTVYRDGCRSGVLVMKDEGDEVKFEQRDAPKRPKKLEGEVHKVTALGEQYNIVVGLLEDKPYEVFVNPGHDLILSQGDIIKRRRGVYSIEGDHNGSKLTETLSIDLSDEETALTRIISTALRHGADIKYIVEQLNKSNGTIVSFSKAIARTLKKYIPNGTESTVTCNDCGSDNVIFQEGCSSCQDCGSSKCG